MLALLFALGLGALAGLTALPHCVAMCGAYAGFACAAARARGAARPTLTFLTGRLVSYVALGALAGATGHALTQFLPPRWASFALSVSLAAGMLALAWRLVRRTPTKLQAAELVTIRRGLPADATPVGNASRELLPALLGGAMALFPCGAIYAALLIAAGTSSAAAGGAVLLGFAVVSGIALAASSWIARSAAALDAHTRRALGAALVIGAFVLVLRPLTSADPSATGTTCQHARGGP